MRVFRSLFTISLVVLFALHCSERTPGPTVSGPEPNPPVVRTPAELTEQEIEVLNSTNKFGINLFKEIAVRTPATENIFISPLSVSYALGLCYNGANGATRDAIGTTLAMADLSPEELNQAYYNLTQILVNADPDVDFRIANSFWSKIGLTIEPHFIDLVRTYFDARAEEIDFTAPWAADTINAWVSEATNGKIEDIVDSGSLRLALAVLLNAIYFNGSWTISFDTAVTRALDFYRYDSAVVESDFMTSDTAYSYWREDRFQLISIPYGDKDFKMVVLLPSEDHTVDELIAELSPQVWASWTSNLEEERVVLLLPKFKFSTETDMTDLLARMGMGLAFSNQADFSAMFRGGGAGLSQVKQKAFVQVDEYGTEAAAVTMVIIIPINIMGPPVFFANRPFLFVIQEDVSGAILFMGKIANPVWEE